MTDEEEDAAEAEWERRHQIRLAAYATLFAAFLAYASAFHDQSGLLLGFGCLIAGEFLSALVHELGHAAAALACGWRVVVFVVRPFGIQLPNRDLAIVPRGHEAGAGGWVGTVPRAAAVDTRRNWTIVLIAGPAASAALAIAAVLVWAAAPGSLGDGLADLGRLSLGLGIQSFYSCLFTLLPGQRPDRTSDGDKLRALRREESRYERNRPVIWVVSLLAFKVRLSALPEWLMTGARGSAGASDDMARYVATLDIGRALDTAPVDIPRARALIDDFRTRYGSNGWLAGCDAYLAAIWERDLERAEAALAEIPAADQAHQLSLAATAAVAAAMREATFARFNLDEMDAALKRESPFSDPTFRDIRRQVEGLIDEVCRVSPALP